MARRKERVIVAEEIHDQRACRSVKHEDVDFCAFHTDR